MADAFRKPSHRIVVEILRALDARFLAAHEIYFGGGARIVLELGEYRESRDIDFLCASQEGYRALRETVSAKSLGKMVRATQFPLAREVRGDQYGVRTWVDWAGTRMKLEIVREARIPLAGARIKGLPVSCLDRPHAFAEKFLANADRGLDASTLSRDAVDLAFMLEGWKDAEVRAGLALAQTAYGNEILRKTSAVAGKLRDDRKYRAQCVRDLAIEDTATLGKGLERLARLG
jgi:hypothetical protein